MYIFVKMFNVYVWKQCLMYMFVKMFNVYVYKMFNVQYMFEQAMFNVYVWK